MKFLQKNRFETCSFEAATSYYVAVDENFSFLLSGTASWFSKGRLPLENIFQKLVSYTWFTVTEKLTDLEKLDRPHSVGWGYQYCATKHNSS